MTMWIGIAALIIAWFSALYMALGIAAMSGPAAFWGGISTIIFGVITKVCMRKSFGG